MKAQPELFKKILVANRGEIAVRVVRACRELGIRSVAVYSEADRAALHCQLADEAVAIGPAPSLESYLHQDRLIEAARRTGSQAIHPGYGFLAENSDFCRRCEKEGIVFIGPKSAALELVGDKVRARQAMEKAGVPIIPGMKSVAADMEDCAAQASRIGYPVMVKASAGGGGKGMRIVCSAEELRPALEAGRREAKSAFGDDSVYLERYIEEPRHVEFQVLADDFGHTVHLFERECSIQRRHQKIIEESPSPALDADLRARMGETARKVMMTAGYNNAGTVEFLLDKDRNFFFLEVNARLQVEHPVTEMVTGVDLVQQQIFIASGRKLELRQEDLRQRGHAVECRIYAENPSRQFLPSPGRILYLKEPAGPGIRHDCGIYSGWEVPIHYDPILAKLIVWAGDREAACRRMLAALDDYVLLGIDTPIPFLKDVLRHPVFREGKATTGFIKAHMEGWAEPEKDGEKRRLALAAAAFLAMNDVSGRRPVAGRAAGAGESPSPWKTLGRFRLGE